MAWGISNLISTQAGGCPSASDAGLLAQAYVLVVSHAVGEVHVIDTAVSCFTDVGHDGSAQARLQDPAAADKRRRRHRENVGAGTRGLLPPVWK